MDYFQGVQGGGVVFTQDRGYFT